MYYYTYAKIFAGNHIKHKFFGIVYYNTVPCGVKIKSGGISNAI